MRMLLNVKFPHDPFNDTVRDGSAGQKMERILQDIQPEAVYFTEQDGRRSAILIVDIDQPAMLPALAEPWFLTFNADVEIRIVMSPEDLRKANLEDLGKKWR